MQRVGMGRADIHPHEHVAAAIGVSDCGFAQADRCGQIAQRQLQFAQIAGDAGCVTPVPARDVILQSSLHRRDSLGQSPQRAQAITRFVQQPSLGAGRERGLRNAPGRRKEAGDGPKVRADRAELVDAVGLRPTHDAVAIDLLAGLLPPLRCAAMRHGLK